MSSRPESRCTQHGLATGPDGSCVLCRRVNVAAEPAADEPASPWLRVALGSLLLAAGAALWASHTRDRGVVLVHLQPAIVQPRIEPPTPVERIKTPEEQMADAERARILREQAARENEPGAEPLQPTAADDLRQRETEARDRARHEAVKKQLAAMSLQGARRNVVIKMYSTSWCGVCSRARNYMQDQKIPFIEYDVEQSVAARSEARALNPRGSVPTLSVDGDVLIGFSPDSLEARIERAAKRRATR